MKNLEIFSGKVRTSKQVLLPTLPRKYYRHIHGFMEEWIYGTLGLWRGLSFFSFDRFVLAVFLVIIFSGFQLVFYLTLGFKDSYLLYFIAVFLAAWLGGSRTAVLAMCLSVVVTAILFQPRLLFMVSSYSNFFELIIFIGGSLFVTFLVTSVAQARRYRDFVTEQLQNNEQHLISTNAYIANLLETVKEGFVACNSDFVITFANTSMQGLLKKRQTRMVGQKIDTVFSKQFVEMFYANYRKYIHIKPGQAATPFEWQFGEKWFSVSVFLREGITSIYFDDITFQKEREQKKDFFIRAAGHELKTPITSMKLFLEIIQSSYKNAIPEEVGTYLGKVQSQINKMTILINSLLDLSRIEGGSGIVVDLKKVDLVILVREAVEVFRFISSNHKIEVDLNSVEEVFADKEKIIQVIVNLISNAIKYSPVGGSVKIKVESCGGVAQVSVQDFGIGIDKQYHQKIFKRFFRIDEKDRQVYPGLGVGLYISYNIIKNHNGSMWVESELGKGSTFYFTLPLVYTNQTETLFVEDKK